MKTYNLGNNAYGLIENIKNKSVAQTFKHVTNVLLPWVVIDIA